MKQVMHTALFAVLILAIGVSALYGVRALLPDYTEEIHVHSATDGQLLPVFEERDELILYPWKELTQAETLKETEQIEPLFWELANAFGFYPASMDFDGAEQLLAPNGMSVGIRNVTAYTAVYDEFPAQQENMLVEHSLAYKLSVAFDSKSLCWFCAEPIERELSAESAEDAYRTLCNLAQAPFETDTPFADFAVRYADICGRMGLTEYVGAVFELLEQGDPVGFLYDGCAYFRYTSDGISLILICDPIQLTVMGFSLETR